MNAAYKVFSENHYKKAPMSEIAEEAGISKSLLFHYFTNKRELYLYLCKQAEELTKVSIAEYSADKLVKYIERECGGQLFCLCGVSLGGQIVMEILSRKPDIAKKAIIDGSLCYPQPKMARYCKAIVKHCSGMMFSKTACKMQLAMLKFFPKMKFPKEIADYYLQDMPRFRMETLYTIYRTYMAEYCLKDSVRNTTAQVMYWYGSKEMPCVKKSAQMFKQLVPACKLYEAKGCNHGYLAIYMPGEWLKAAGPFLEK